MHIFWSRIRSLIKSKDVSYLEVSKACNCSSSIFSRCKRTHVPNAQTATNLANYLHTSVEYLLTGSEVISSPEVHFTDEFTEEFDKLPLELKKNIMTLISISEQTSQEETWKISGRG